MTPTLIIALVQGIAALAEQVPALIDAIKAHPDLSETERRVLLAQLETKLIETAQKVAEVDFRQV